MAVPVLKLNLAPPPTFWRRRHALLSWAALGLGALALLLSAGYTWRAYRLANQMGRSAFLLSRQTQDALARQGSIQAQLRAIDVQKELPRWKLAERILGERSTPWSRLTAELERSLVQDVRIRALQRARGADQRVVAKLKGEARSREAEAAFVECIQKNAFFAQVVLERESERQGGGIEFECTLPVAATPPPYVPLPKYGPPPRPRTAEVKAPQPAAKPAPSKPVPSPAPPPAATPRPVAAPVAPRPSLAAPPQSPQESPGLRPMRNLRPLPPENRGGPRRPAGPEPSTEVKR